MQSNVKLNLSLDTLIEIIASALGLIGIFLQIKQNPLYWLTSILMVSLYIYVFFVSKFYADMAFQFYYLAISIYGWIYWAKSRNKRTRERNTDSKVQNESKLEVNVLNRKLLLYSIVLSLIFYVVIYLILSRLTNSDVPHGDAFTTALSIVATFLLARKFIENWIFWIIVDAVSLGLYIYKGLYPTAILFFALTILAFVGYFKWKKELENLC